MSKGWGLVEQLDCVDWVCPFGMTNYQVTLNEGYTFAGGAYEGSNTGIFLDPTTFWQAGIYNELTKALDKMRSLVDTPDIGLKGG